MLDEVGGEGVEVGKGEESEMRGELDRRTSADPLLQSLAALDPSMSSLLVELKHPDTMRRTYLCHLLLYSKYAK